ncbi:MAG: class I SAM-dependent DNA methyltransferase [Candidatus Thorarchaeota archaeon]
MTSFDEIALAYDNSIDWGARLRREVPFLKQSMNLSAPVRLLDMACGTGRHAAALSSPVVIVTAFDSSESMIVEAKKHAVEKDVSVSFLVADMQDFTSIIDGPFDFALCLGNSLALLPNFEALSNTVSNVHNIMDSGGAFVFQVLNFQEILQSGFRFFPIKGGITSSGNDVVFSRFYEHSGDDWSTLVATSFVKTGTQWVTSISTQQVLHTTRDTIYDVLQTAGFNRLEFYSDYQQGKFSPESSRNMIVRARRT